MAVNVKGSGGKIIKPNPNVLIYPQSGALLSTAQKKDISLESRAFVQQDVVINKDYIEIVNNGFYTVYRHKDKLQVIEYHMPKQEYNNTWDILPPNILNPTNSYISDNTFENCQIILKDPNTLLMIVNYGYMVSQTIFYPGYGIGYYTSGCVIYKRSIYSDDSWTVVGKYSNHYINGAAAEVNESADVTVVDIKNSHNEIGILSRRTTQQNSMGNTDVRSTSDVYVCNIYTDLIVNDIDNMAQSAGNFLPGNSYLKLSLENNSNSKPITITDLLHLIIKDNIYYFHYQSQYKKYDIDNQSFLGEDRQNKNKFYVLNNLQLCQLDFLINERDNSYSVTLTRMDTNNPTVLSTHIVADQIIPIFNINNDKELTGLLYTNDMGIFLFDILINKSISLNSLDIDITKPIGLFGRFVDENRNNPYENKVGYLIYQNNNNERKKAMYCQNLLLSD